MNDSFSSNQALQYAGLRPRFLAFLWDYVPILVYIGLLVLLALAIPVLQSLFRHPVQADVVAFLILIVPVMLYFALQEGGPQQATWGKRKMGLKVVRMGNARLATPRAMLRSVIKFLPWQLAHTAIYQSQPMGVLPQFAIWVLFLLAYGLVIIYIVLIWWNPTHRTLYDWVAGSAVVENRTAEPTRTTTSFHE